MLALMEQFRILIESSSTEANQALARLYKQTFGTELRDRSVIFNLGSHPGMKYEISNHSKIINTTILQGYYQYMVVSYRNYTMILAFAGNESFLLVNPKDRKDISRLIHRHR